MSEDDTYKALMKPTYKEMYEMYILNKLSFKPYSYIEAFFARHGWVYADFYHDWMHRDE